MTRTDYLELVEEAIHTNQRVSVGHGMELKCTILPDYDSWSLDLILTIETEVLCNVRRRNYEANPDTAVDNLFTAFTKEFKNLSDDHAPLFTPKHTRIVEAVYLSFASGQIVDHKDDGHFETLDHTITDLDSEVVFPQLMDAHLRPILIDDMQKAWVLDAESKTYIEPAKPLQIYGEMFGTNHHGHSEPLQF